MFSFFALNFKSIIWFSILRTFQKESGKASNLIALLFQKKISLVRNAISDRHAKGHSRMRGTDRLAISSCWWHRVRNYSASITVAPECSTLITTASPTSRSCPKYRWRAHQHPSVIEPHKLCLFTICHRRIQSIWRNIFRRRIWSRGHP